jgi:hypothetical protein
MVTRKNKLTTVFDGDDRPFQKKLKRVQGAARKTGAIVNKLGGALAAVGVSAGLSAAIQKFDRIGKIANRLNMSAEALQRLGFAAEQSGASMEKLQGIMTRLERRTGEAQQNATGTQAKRFKELNIELESFAKLNPEEKIMAMADAFNALGGTEQSVASLMGLLDTEVRELIPLLKLGGDGINNLGNQISVVANQAIKDIEQASDDLNKFKNQMMVSSAQPISFMTKIMKGVERFKFSLALMGPNNEYQKRYGENKPDVPWYNLPYFATDEEFAAQKRFNEYDSSVAMKMAERADTKSRAESILNRRKAGISLLKQQIKDRDIKGLLNRTPTGKFIQGFGSMFKRATGTSVGETLQSKARDLNLAFRKSGGFENIQDKFREAKAIARGKPSERLLNNLGFFAGAGGKPEETFGSQTSGRFGQFVAAASLGSGKGRRISQARGIRIQGLDKSVLIQEDTKKLLEQLVERTRER